MADNKTLGVLGGLGPMATVYFYELVTTHTLVEKDQDHIDMILSSKATTPDRTAYILDNTRPNPFAVMQEEAKRLVAYGADILAIPCNTAHYFYEGLMDAVDVPVLNMVGDTVWQVRRRGGKKAGILATDGTVQSGTYQRECAAQGLDFAVPGADAQAGVMQVIYAIKAGRAPDMQAFNTAAGQLLEKGCDTLVLGCTELSLVKKQHSLDERYIDSMEVLAEAAITACGKTPTGFNH